MVNWDIVLDRNLELPPAFRLPYKIIQVMEACDNGLIGNFFALTGAFTSLDHSQPCLVAFRQKYGTYIDEQSGYQIAANWQTALGQSANVGPFIGILISAPLRRPHSLSMDRSDWTDNALELHFPDLQGRS